MRKLALKTRRAYICAVLKLTHFLKHSPATATAEELRLFQLQLVAQGVSAITINTTLTDLRFLFEETLQQHATSARVRRVTVLKRLLEVLNIAEIKRFMAAIKEPYGFIANVSSKDNLARSREPLAVAESTVDLMIECSKIVPITP